MMVSNKNGKIYKSSPQDGLFCCFFWVEDMLTRVQVAVASDF